MAKASTQMKKQTEVRHGHFVGSGQISRIKDLTVDLHIQLHLHHVGIKAIASAGPNAIATSATRKYLL